MESTHTNIRGWGIDLAIHDRPGYPLEQEHVVGHDTLGGQSPQPVEQSRGLSGLLRQSANKLPDWKPRRWMLLMLADRVDVLESKLTFRRLIFTGLLGAVALAAKFTARRG